VVDDFEPFRRFVVSTLRQRPEFQIVGEVSDGVGAVQKAFELQPDVLVLDIGLPKLNGIEAARQISERAPNAKIVFLSENRSMEVVQEALRVGGGYVLKSSARGDLLPALDCVLAGQRFVSSSLNGRKLSH
jgi:DNA-binding NarL/FixJ family response regulator